MTEEAARFTSDGTMHFNMPQTKWTVEIPKGSTFCVHYCADLTWRQRVFFRFIGWGVTKGDKK